MKKLIFPLWAMIAALPHSAFAGVTYDTPTLTEILTDKAGITRRLDRRFNAFRTSGVSFGSCAGMNRRQDEIRVEVEVEARNLDAIYNFAALAIRADTPGMPTCKTGDCKVTTTEGYIIPPVLSHLKQTYSQKSDDLIRVSDAVYKIRSQAHFSSAPPTWRSYLQTAFKFEDCAAPPVELKSQQDREAWDEGVKEGWARGYDEGAKVLRENLERLNRDFLGMVLYHKLLRLGMVTRPIAAGASMGVTGDANTMHVNESVYRIQVKPEFNLEPSKWK